MKMGYKRNKLQQLKLFCAIVEEGTIIKAAEKMNTAQPNVSLQIKSLEKSLKVELFKREKQRLTPTPQAMRYYKMCKKSIEEMDFLLGNAMDVIKEDYDNLIKISAHSYMLSHILPPYFKEMIEVNPKVKFELYNSNYTEAMDMLEAGIVDFAVLPADLKSLPKNIEAINFHKCKFGIVLSKHHPIAAMKDEDITWNIISKYDFVNLGKGITAQGFRNAMKENQLNSRFVLHNGTWEICSGIANEGIAITGTDEGYLKSFKGHSDLIVKKCPTLLPEYAFYILQNTKSISSNSSKELIRKIMQSKS